MLVVTRQHERAKHEVGGFATGDDDVRTLRHPAVVVDPVDVHRTDRIPESRFKVPTVRREKQIALAEALRDHRERLDEIVTELAERGEPISRLEAKLIVDAGNL